MKSLRRSLTVVLFFRQEMVEIKILLGCCIPRIIIKYGEAFISYKIKLDVGNRLDFIRGYYIEVK